MSSGTSRENTGPIDVGIIVALQEEFRELHPHLRQPIQRRDESTGITDYLFEHPVQSGAPYRCAATFIDDMGPTAAALATERFLSRRNPGTLVMLGIAGGIDGDIKLGDVVVAKHVGCYLENARIESGRQTTFDIRPGGESYPCTAPLTRIAANLEFAGDGIYRNWQTSSTAELATLVPQADRREKLIQENWLGEQPQLVTGMIASGPVVAASEEFVKWMLSVNRRYRAVEMEAGGMLTAMYSSGLPARSLVLRGVSDFGDQRKAELDQVGKGGLRKYAMRNTVRLLWSLLEAGAIPRVKAGAPSARAAVPLELPPAAEQYFGRGEEVKRLAERLKAGKNSAVVGAAGMGKTALAAEAVAEAVGTMKESLPQSPFPDGVFFLDLYAMHAVADEAWNALANKVAAADFLEDKPARVRAVEACRRRRLLLIVEGAESADGAEGRAELAELLGVLSPENRRLVLTRDKGQVDAAESIELTEALAPDYAGGLLDSLTKGHLTLEVREQVLELLQGHPLALTWAGNLIGRDDDAPDSLVKDWKAEALPSLTDPKRAKLTLRWLFDRSVRGLDETAKRVLSAAGLLAHAPFPLAAVAAALGEAEKAGQSARTALRSLTQRSLLRHMEGDFWQFSHVLGYRFARRERGSDSNRRLGLAGWLRSHVEGLLAGPADRAALTRALEHVGALLRTDEDQSLWRPLANPALYDIADRLEEMGHLALMKTSLSAVAGWMDVIPSHEADAPFWKRERATLLNRQGDVLNAQGDLSGALAAYRESLAVIRPLADSDPSNTTWRHDLSVSQINVGDVLTLRADLDGALTAYQEALAVRRQLAQSEPSNATWQRELTVSQSKVGDVLRAQGDQGGAFGHYREGLAISRRLAESDPSNANWQRDLCVSQTKVGDMLQDQGDLGGALAAYRDALAVSRPLAESDPSNATWQRDLSVGQNRLGELLKAQGDLDGALAAYQQDLAISQRLAESDPSNANWQRDLRYSLNRIAEIFERQGNRSQASTLAQESLKIAERLAELDPTNAIWQKDVTFTRKLVARLRQQGGSK